jgi:phosphoesterase RecJ-like protein
MDIQTMKQVLEKIKEYDRIILFRHIRPDGDAVGSTKGLKEIIKSTYPKKEVHLINDDFSGYLSFLGGEDAPIEDELYTDALGIVMDTANAERVSNQKFKLCKEIVKIDHHISVDDFGDINLVDETKSSASEMVANFYYTFKDELKLDSEAAKYIYLGMVTDSGRFRYHSVTGDTMRLAGMLLDTGIDVDTMYSNLYVKDFSEYKFMAFVYSEMKMTENGVAYILVDNKTKEKFNLTNEQAGNAVSCMEGIKGSLIWIAFIETEESIRVRLRSRFVTINDIGEKYHGGGHACASGATVYSMEELNFLLSDADAKLKEYKETHEGWI